MTLRNFRVLSKKPKKETELYFRARINYVHGDADLYKEEEMYYQSEEELLRFLEMLDVYYAMDARNARNRQEVERHLPHYEEFYGGDPWPGDVTTDGFNLAGIDSVELEWFDGERWVPIEQIKSEKKG